jgi:hypothetical protein
MGDDVGFAGCRYAPSYAGSAGYTKTIELHYIYTNKETFEEYNFDDRI